MRSKGQPIVRLSWLTVAKRGGGTSLAIQKRFLEMPRRYGA